MLTETTFCVAAAAVCAIAFALTSTSPIINRSVGDKDDEMEVNADLLGVDLCNPYVLLFLAEQTAYHHAFWPHTKKRFIAFKNILRRNRQVKESLQDFAFYSLIDSKLKQLESQTDNPLYFTPGGSKEIENIQQVISIVEKVIAESK